MISSFNQLNIVYNEIDAELKRNLKKSFKNTTIDHYLQLLNDCKDIWWFLTKRKQKYAAHFTNFSQTNKQFQFNLSFTFFTTIVLKFSIHRNTITEINKKIKEVNFSINSTTEDFISTRTRIKIIKLNIETLKSSSIETFKDFIIKNCFFATKLENSTLQQ